jgi:RHS repeat-associated protein
VNDFATAGSIANTSRPANLPAHAPHPIIAPTGSPGLNSVIDVVNLTVSPFQSAPPAEQGVAGAVAQGLGGVMGLVGAPAMIIDTAFAAMTAPIAAMFPSMPAVTLLGMHVGVPHAHTHPPSLIPPAPPVPLPSMGMLVGSGAVTVMIGGMPAARAGDIGISVTCGSLAPPFEVFTGSSNVFIGGARAARVMDITKHCNPTSMGPFAIAMGAAGVVAGAAGAMAANNIFAAAQAAADAAVLAVKLLCGKDPGIPPGMGTLVGPPVPNVLIGGFPCPPVGEMAVGALLRGLQKALKALKGLAKKGNGHCAEGSHPIYLVTGENFDSFVDFVSGGLFEWRRHYTTARFRADSPIGHGWRHFYQRSLRVRLHRAVFTDWDGVAVEFPRFERGSTVTRAEGYVLQRLARGHYRLSHRSDPVMEFMGGEFDGELRLYKISKQGRELEFSYDVVGRLAGATETAARSDERRQYQFAYDDDGHIVQLIEVPVAQPGAWAKPDPVVRAAYSYSKTRDLSQAMNAMAGVWTYEFDAFHRLTKQTDPRHYSYTFKYDANGRCVAAAGQDGLWSCKVEYFPEENRTRYTENGSATRDFHYDKDGYVTKIVDPYGGEFVRERDGEGKLVKEVDSGGRTDEWLYDADGAHVARIDRFGNVFPPELDQPKVPNAFERVLPSTPLGWQFAGLIEPSPQAMLGLEPSALYSIPPELESQAQHCFRVRDERQGPLPKPRVERDLMGRTTREVDELGRSRQWEYDATGNVISMRDRDGQTTTRHTVSWNLVGQQVDAVGNAMTYQHSQIEQVVGVADPLGNETRYDYDLKERLVRVHRHDRVRDEYVYDDGDHLIEKRDGTGQVLFTNEPHDNHFVKKRTLASGGFHEYDYDARGRIIEASTQDHEVTLKYQGNGPPMRDMRDEKGVDHRWYGPTWWTTVLEKFTLSSTTGASRAELVDPMGGATLVSHDKTGCVRRYCSNGTVEIAQYDAEGRLEARLAYKRDRFGRTTGWSTSYTYTAEGDLVQVVDTARGTTRFEVDAAHRLIGELTPRNERHTYRQDPAGNVVSKPGLPTLGVGKGNLLVSSQYEAFEHDARDHLGERRRRDGARTRYIYDSSDMLVRVEGIAADGTPEPAWEAKYDGLARRISTERAGKKREFYWDHDRLAAEIFPDGHLRVYQYAGRKALVPIGFIEYEHKEADPGSGKSYHVFSNPVGMPLCIEDERGEIVWWAERVDPYGRIDVRPGAKVEYNLRWPGHYFDPETSLHYNRYRYYDPGLGRYLQSDPLGYGGSPVNLYAYCPNPLVEVDVLGLHDTKKKGNNSEPEHERTERPAKEEEISPVTGEQVQGAHTVVEHTVDGKPVARYYVDEKGRTIRAEGLLNPPAKYQKEGVSHIKPPEFESGRDHRGHLIPERSVPHQDAVNVKENVIAEHGTKSNLSEKKKWENQAFDRSQKDPGSWSVHEPQYDGDSMRPSSVDHSLYDSKGNEVPGMSRNIENPE